MEHDPFTIHDLKKPVTAGEVWDVAVNGPGFVEDNYHALLVTGARRLKVLDFGHFEYRTGWGSSTLWGDPNSEGTLVIDYEGKIRW